MEQISSRSNPLCVRMKKLSSSRAYREETGEFFCDSPKLLHEAVRWGAEITCVMCTGPEPPEPLPPGTRAVQVTQSVMDAVSPMRTPQGVVFSCRLPEETLPETLEGRHYLVLDAVQDPGNVGTILRTADAFDCDGVFLLPGCADLYHPKTLRAAMGVHFRRSLIRCDLEPLDAALKRARVPLRAAALGEDAEDIRCADLSRCAVVIGSEGQGVSPEVLSRCERPLRIPMSGRCESLNAAAAAAVVLWEMRRDG